MKKKNSILCANCSRRFNWSLGCLERGGWKHGVELGSGLAGAGDITGRSLNQIHRP